jgi:carbon monoxide dehydrogenase subunit G
VTAFFFLLLVGDLFIVDVSHSISYTVDVPRPALRELVDDVGLFARNMPGVVGIEDLGDGVYLYHTRKDVPLGSALETSFRIRRIVESDTVTHYRSTDPQAENYMSCTVTVMPEGDSRTSIGIALRVRLAREHPSDVHWLAPILGEEFIEAQMTKDLTAMLTEFAENSSAEMRGIPVAATGTR